MMNFILYQKLMKKSQIRLQHKGKHISARIRLPTGEVKSEFGDTKTFCLAFPWLFPGGTGDTKENILYEISISDWAQKLLFYEDGIFARDKLWCFLQ